MDALTFSPDRLSRSELVVGLSGSLVAHVAIFAAALILPWAMPRKTVQIPFYSVNLVGVEELGSAGSAGSKKALRGPSSEAQRVRDAQKTASPASRRAASTPVVPVKRLQFDEAKTRNETELKRLETKDVPEASESAQPAVSVDKSLESLIPKPKARPKPSPVAQEKGAENDKPAGSQDSGQEQTQKTSTGKGTGSEKGSATAAAKGGPPGSEAGSPDGASVGLARRLYYTEVWNAIRRQWALPEFLKSQNLEAVLVIVVRRDGKILNIQFEKKSGQALYDESVERAVRKADPLPPFPEIYSPPKEEIGLRFRPEDLA